jgi:hypothetical protein
MKQCSLLLVAGLAVAGSIICVWQASRTPERGLVPDKSVCHFGEVDQGKTFTATFHLANRESESVKVVSITKNCDCTKPEMTKTSLGPGESADLKIEWKSGASRGEIESHIQVIYMKASGGAPEKTVLRLAAIVIPDIACEPSELVFKEGVKETQQVTLSPRHPDLKCLQAYCTQRAFKVVSGVENMRLSVSFEPARWAKDLRGAFLLIKTTNPTEPYVRIPIRVVR